MKNAILSSTSSRQSSATITTLQERQQQLCMENHTTSKKRRSIWKMHFYFFFILNTKNEQKLYLCIGGFFHLPLPPNSKKTTVFFRPDEREREGRSHAQWELSLLASFSFPLLERRKKHSENRIFVNDFRNSLSRHHCLHLPQYIVLTA